MAANHGHTVAAWTAVAVIMLAFIVGAVGILMSNWIVFWVAVILAVVGGVLGKVLQLMGFGQSASHS